MNWIILAIVGYFAYPLVLKPSAVKLVARLPPAREAMFRHAMKETNPAKLADMADAFRGEGFAREADQLRARARLRAHPKETLEKYQEIIKKALSSTNVKAIEDVADAFRADGAGSVAELLDDYAAGLSTLQGVPPVIVPASALAPVAPPPAMSQAPGVAPQAPPPQAVAANGDSVYVPPGVPPDVLASLGVTAPPVPQQYDVLSGRDPYTVDSGNMPDNRPLGVPPGNNPYQANGQPGIGLPGVMPVRSMP
jgi:hypothetical protein